MKTKILFPFLFLFFPFIQAQNPGDFDPSFASIGYRTEISPDEVYAQAVSVMQDGRIVASGMSYNGGGVKRIHLYRYLTNGQLDSTFAQTGEMIASGPQVDSDDFDFVVQPDGKIILYYYMYPQSVDEALVTGRLNVDGTMDVSFGNAGWVIDSSETAIGYPDEVLLQQDGKIIVTGVYTNDTTYEHGFFAQRMLADGTIDGSYGTGGVAYLPISVQYFHNQSALLQPDGKLLFMGNVDDSLLVYAFNVVVGRLLSNGAPDTTMGVNGFTYATHNGFYGGAYAMAQGPQGEIYLLGENPNSISQADISLLKLHDDGSKDITFGTNAWFVCTSLNYDLYGYDLKVQSDGKILLSCEGANASLSQATFNILRVLPNGAMDASFGTNGIANPTMSYSYNGAFALDLQADGKIVAVGESATNQVAHFTIARYLASSTTALNPEKPQILVEVFPNPSNGATQLRFALAQPSNVRITVMDLAGRVVLQPLVGQELEATTHSFTLETAGLPNGTYLVRMQTDESAQTLRLVVAH